MRRRGFFYRIRAGEIYRHPLIIVDIVSNRAPMEIGQILRKRIQFALRVSKLTGGITVIPISSDFPYFRNA